MKPFSHFLRGAALVLPLLVGCVQAPPAQGAEEEHPHALTPQRIAALPEGERGAWQTYYNRSQAYLAEEKRILAAEVKAAGLEKPLPAPGNSGFGGFASARKKPAEWFGSDEARQMADAAITFQTPTGGWAKGTEFNQGARKPGMHWGLKADGWYYVGTFDNGVFMGTMTALAKIATATKEPKYAAAFCKGLDYLFDAQFPNGGWPQIYPLAGWYHDEVTYNDAAMTGNVSLLRDVAKGEAPFAFVDAERRARAKTATEAGLRCILKTQIVQNGKLTAWCAQHDPITLEAAPARAFEVASVSGWESADVVRFLMSIENPTPEIKTAIEGAVAWFQSSKITGFEVVSGKNAVGGRTYTLQPNPTAPPLWGRFYEIGTNRPVFVTRDVKIFYNLADLDQSGPGNGYNWYVTQPGSLLEKDYPKWRAKWGAERKIPDAQNGATLAAKDAEIKGQNARLENDGANLGFWNNPDTQFSWLSNLRPGVYRVSLNYALDAEHVGSEIQLQIGEKSLSFKPAATGGWRDYKTLKIGEVEVKQSGALPVVMSARSVKGEFILNLREITLAPR